MGSHHYSTYYFEVLFAGCMEEDVGDGCVGADIEEAVHRATIRVHFHSSLLSLRFNLLSSVDLESRQDCSCSPGTDCGHFQDSATPFLETDLQHKQQSGNKWTWS